MFRPHYNNPSSLNLAANCCVNSLFVEDEDDMRLVANEKKIMLLLKLSHPRDASDALMHREDLKGLIKIFLNVQVKG